MTHPDLAGFAPGLYTVNEHHLVAVSQQARLQGYRIARFNLAQLSDKPTLLNHFAEAMMFPDWFGHNLDALADCLSDLDWLPSSGHVLIFSHCNTLNPDQAGWFNDVMDVIAQCIDLRAQHELPMWAFCDNPIPLPPPE